MDKWKYPKMIIFDYGHTLLYEPGWDSVRGNAELLKYVTKNPNNYTLEDVRKAAELIFGKHIENIRKIGYDIGGQVCDKVLYAYLGIEFSLTPLEMETVFWNGASMGAIMPEADKMLDYINKKGIRSAVISNLLWSGAALSERLNRLLVTILCENPIVFYLILLCKNPVSVPMKYGTVVIIHKQIFKERRKSVCTLYGMITIPKENIKTTLWNMRQNVNICISVNGMK